MDLRESLGVAFGAILANKLRSFLTMLGIIIGVGALITVVAVGKGGERAVAERLQALGTNLLYVSPGSSRSGPVMTSAGSSVKLTRKDLEAVLASCEEIEAIVPEFSRSAQVKYGNRNWNTRITGTTPNYGEVRNVKAVAGRYFTAAEEAARARVCLIGSTVRENLFDPEEDPLDKTLRIGRMNFTVIGVLETKGQAGGWMNPDDQVLIPLATAQMRLFGVDHLTNSTLKVADASLMEKAFYDVERVLRKQHRLRDDQDNDFHIRNQADIISTFESTQKTITMMLTIVAIVSLLVGGIGIMNIMLVSVTERTREIGIRKAIGAKRRNILTQFLLEALALSITGGLLGIMMGVGLSRLVTQLMGWQTLISPSSIMVSVVFAAAVGILFGLYPAWRAARQETIEALRYE
ncbi:MAG: ABC transporter permease [candidate division KSB1 bacterium]|nr:ABC transporter permease [candidate division KSB1 bacterium]MDZ7276511.1 ABC transporter permease [candidate division KSB1 bacterium]MDZ7286708.1 ABC transporter permease [candidate division KSB1 bacterium]MDZ7300281.1 ABC transporter permease [candidate division KSB1 bacterium]MDZ7307882.1 ABC transporter permease [candidate division KSB1 bacterium]